MLNVCGTPPKVRRTSGVSPDADFRLAGQLGSTWWTETPARRDGRNDLAIVRHLTTTPNYVQIGSHKQQVKAVDFARCFALNVEGLKRRTRCAHRSLHVRSIHARSAQTQ